MATRLGIGFDLHRLKEASSGSVPLGGVAIPCGYAVDAHSDGDVLLHALVDGMLGALAMGDIGRHFPDTDPKNTARPSSEFVEEILAAVHKKGWKVAQIDSNIFTEMPKIAPHADAIRKRVAELLQISVDDVSVKAKSAEGLGAIGNKRAIAAQVAVVLEKK